ncbi:MAG: DUF975 family protein [Ruminococcaceae bacterium]|nr:DUF975 family protein [Oscillospiraceae bacterium]
MWDRRELKARGKAAFQANYWKCVIVALILGILVGGGAAAGKDKAEDAAEANGTTIVETIKQTPKAVLAVFAGVLVGVLAAGSAIKLLVFNPLRVGCKRFFLVNSDAPAELDELLCGFRNGYGRVVAGMLLRDMYIALWSLLFVIPGIVKAYSYRMVPYILAEDPSVGGKEAIAISKQMMHGHKWNAFMLDLSFFGWYFLAAITADVIGVLWTGPYTEATDAELYKTIRAL